MKRALLTLVAAASMVGGTAIATSTASAGIPPAPEWHLAYDNTNSMPKKTAGTACTAGEVFDTARTAWNTVIGCNRYTTSKGATAYHWTYLKLDANSNLLCTSDGYLYNGTVRTYVGYCGPVVSPRLPWISGI